jgi:hypothetical protein
MENEEEKIDIDFEESTDQSEAVSSSPSIINTIGDVIDETVDAVTGLGEGAELGSEADLGADANANAEPNPTLLNTIGNAVNETVNGLGLGANAEAEAKVEEAAVAPKPKTRKKTPFTNSTKTRKARKQKIYPSVKTADEWVRYKASYPKLYDVSPEGDYYTDPVLESGERQTTATIQPKVYYRSDERQLKERYDERDAKVAEAEDAYATARKELMEVMNSYRAGVALTSEVVIANMKVADAEKVRNKYAYHKHESYFVDPRPPLMQLDFDVRYVSPEKRFPFEVIRFGIDRFPWEFHYSDTLASPVVVVEEPQAQPEPQQEEREFSKAQIGAIIGKKRALTRPPMPKF